MIVFDRFKLYSYRYVKHLVKYFPQCTGTYLIVIVGKKDKLIEIKYIGTCLNFRHRMTVHLTALKVMKELGKGQKMRIWLLKHGRRGRLRIEGWFIKKYKPQFNKTNPVIGTSRWVVKNLIKESNKTNNFS